MGFRERIAELARGSPAPETQDSNFDNGIYSTDVGEIERRDPRDNELEKYWKFYKNEPLVRAPIQQFANDVTEPGYKIYADSPELEEDLDNVLDECAIVAGESGHGFLEVLRQTVIQKEVRGTGLVELVPREGQVDNPDSMWGFRVINPATVSALTYDDKAVLIDPHDSMEDVPVTARDESAAYVQFHEAALLGPFDDKEEVPLSQNDLVKVTQDPDTSDIWGTSRIESVAHEIEGLRQIKRDNEEAIAAKAYPHWVIKVGQPDAEINEAGRVAGMWPEEKMRQLKNKHSRSNFKPGQKDIVPGDVQFQKLSGETADLERTISHYVEYILAAMPTPKYAVGFSDEINRDVTGPQADNYQRQVERTRRQLEDAFQQALQRKARDLGYEDGIASSVSVRLEPERGSNPMKDDSFNVGEFQSFMQGIATASQVSGGQPVMTRDEIRTRVLGLERYEEIPDELQPTVDNPEDAEAENAETDSETDETNVSD